MKFLVGTAGFGPRLLFITGSSADLRKPNTPLSSQLAQHFEVLSYDQRGMGQSDKPDIAYSMHDYAADAVAILDAVGWQSALVAGYSFGGMVAQEMAIEWPTRVSRLALLASTAGGAGGSSYPIEELAGLAPIEKARRSLEISDLGFSPEWQQENPDIARKKVHARMRTQSMYKHELNALIGSARQLKARAQHNTFDRLSSIVQPTMVLAGDRDGQAPLASQRTMADRIPNCEFKVINGSHGLLWESNQAFQEIIKFMRPDELTNLGEA